MHSSVAGMCRAILIPSASHTGTWWLVRRPCHNLLGEPRLAPCHYNFGLLILRDGAARLKVSQVTGLLCKRSLDSQRKPANLSSMQLFNGSTMEVWQVSKYDVKPVEQQPAASCRDMSRANGHDQVMPLYGHTSSMIENQLP